METPLTAASEIAISTLRERAPQAFDLAAQFKAAGFHLALVGGPVRDSLLGRLGNDLDFTTSARPEDTKKILRGWADDIWDVGIKFGTIAARKNETTIEVTTYRSESYDVDSRNPEVQFGNTIADDLRRRDFTVNAMAIELTTSEVEFIDLFGGVTDLLKRSFPRLSRHESTLRTAVQISLEQQALFKAGLTKDPPFRRGHRIRILDKALEPLKQDLPKDIYLQLHRSLSMVYGVEIFIVLKDIWNESNKQVLATMLWMSDALIESALRQAKARKKEMNKQEKS